MSKEFKVTATIKYDDSGESVPLPITGFNIECFPDGQVPVAVIADVIAFTVCYLVTVCRGHMTDRQVLAMVLNKIMTAEVNRLDTKEGE